MTHLHVKALIPVGRFRFSLTLTQSVCTHQRKNKWTNKQRVQNIYISCTSKLYDVPKPFPREMGHHAGGCKKISSTQWHHTRTDLRKMLFCYLQQKINIWESTEGLGNTWQKPRFSWQRPSPAYRFRLHLPSMPRFPNWPHPKISMCVLWGFCPQQTPGVQGAPRMAMAPQGFTPPWGRPSCPPSSTDDTFKAFASCVWPQSPTLLSQGQ